MNERDDKPGQTGRITIEQSTWFRHFLLFSDVVRGNAKDFDGKKAQGMGKGRKGRELIPLG